MAAKAEQGSAPPAAGSNRLEPPDLAKFTGLVALLAILSDAAVGHALAWENDPYWTYWITKTFLIATIFGLGTAWLGVGVGSGALVTAVHTIVLTVYYWSLSPIGLPSHPTWLDLEHTWISGLPIHFGVIYLGYLAALWIWRRRDRAAIRGPRASRSSGAALEALIIGTFAVVAIGALEALAIGEFQGVTWYVVRLLIVVPFLLAWTALAGRDARSAVGGSIVLTAVLITYSHFLGPVGLPDLPLRIFEQEAPGATVHWLTFRQEALVAMPISFAVLIAVFMFLARRVGGALLTARGVLALAIGALIVAGAGAAIWPRVTPTSNNATVTAGGAAQAETGPYYEGPLVAANGTLTLRAIDRNPRVTPLRPHDTVSIQASIDHPDGHRYTVRATRPMVGDPLGRFTTWWGVGMDAWHHGRSGIGSSLVPATHSEVAVFALGSVDRDGSLVAAGVPVHVMTMEENRVELDVGDPAVAVPGLPDGHLRAVWDTASIRTNHEKTALYIFGSVVLIALLVLTGTGLRLDDTLDRR